jgi:DNA-binding SARP family transcriptional activator
MDSELTNVHDVDIPIVGADSGYQYRLALLGGFSLMRRNERISLPFSVQRLIAFLALHPHELVRTYVAGILWPDSTQARADASLRSTLWRLQICCAQLIRSSNSHIKLADSLSVDVHDVVVLVRRLMNSTAVCLNEDLDPGRLTDELLPDWTADDWIFVERERLRQLCLHGLEALSLRLLDLGRYGEAVEAGLAAVRAEPLRESAHRVLISIYLTEGNASEALRQYDWYRRLLRAELGIDPSAHVTQLVQNMR